MKIIKIIAYAVMLYASNSLFANQGLAFIHGTGNQTDAYNDYWTGEFVNSVKQGLSNTNNVTVINCDFDKYMWDTRASGCLAEQLTTFINSKNISQLTLITHSNGGNVVRWILSNPTWDSRFVKIINTVTKTIALAPSSGGTPLADAVTTGNTFETTLGWILGYSC